MNKNNNFLDSLFNALNGVSYALKYERNFKTHFLLGTLALILGIVLKLETLEITAIFLCICFVLSAELINTAIEATIDLFCNDKFYNLAKIAKDTAAGAVLVTAVTSAIVGYNVYVDNFIDSLYTFSIKSIHIYIGLICFVFGILIFLFLYYKNLDKLIYILSDFIFSILAYGLTIFIFLFSKNYFLLFISILLSSFLIYGKEGINKKSTLKNISSLLFSICFVVLFLKIIWRYI